MECIHHRSSIYIYDGYLSWELLEWICFMDIQYSMSRILNEQLYYGYIVFLLHYISQQDTTELIIMMIMMFRTKQVTAHHVQFFFFPDIGLCRPLRPIHCIYRQFNPTIRGKKMKTQVGCYGIMIYISVNSIKIGDTIRSILCSII